MTRASNERPTRRMAQTRSFGDLATELRADTLTLRPKGARRGGPAEVVIPLGLVYQQALARRAEGNRRR